MMYLNRDRAMSYSQTEFAVTFGKQDTVILGTIYRNGTGEGAKKCLIDNYVLTEACVRILCAMQICSFLYNHRKTDEFRTRSGYSPSIQSAKSSTEFRCGRVTFGLQRTHSRWDPEANLEDAGKNVYTFTLMSSHRLQPVIETRFIKAIPLPKSSDADIFRRCNRRVHGN
jgi:hypothetical protein